METLKIEKKLCVCCMEEHKVRTVRVRERNAFKGVEVEFDATYEYCEPADEYIATEEILSANDMAMKNACRQMMGLLTAEQIGAIRAKYGISQSDLAALLGWGGKTIEGRKGTDYAGGLCEIYSDGHGFV